MSLALWWLLYLTDPAPLAVPLPPTPLEQLVAPAPASELEDERIDALPTAPPPRPRPAPPTAAGESRIGALAPPDTPPLVAGAGPARADGLPFTCASRYLIDVETGTPLVADNITRRLYPASTTKIMTTLLALEALASGRCGLEDPVPISPAAAAVLESGLWLTAGEVLSVRELLIGIMVRSANDASQALAEFLGGTVEGFVAEMNRRAAELGCLDTHFVNPHGLHEGPRRENIGDQHYTCAYDLMLMTLEAWRHPFFRELCLMDGVTVSWRDPPGQPPPVTATGEPAPPHPPTRMIHNRNKLLGRYAECIGVKTGYTRQAGACLVSAARRGEREVLAVTLHSASGGDRWLEAEALLRYGLDAYRRVELLGEGVPVAAVPVRGGRAPTVPAVATRGLVAVIPADAPEPTVEFELEPELPAPLKAGLPVGAAVLALPGGEPRRVPVAAAEDVPADGARPWRPLGPLTLVWLGLVGYGTLAETHGRRRALLPTSG